MNRKLAAVLLAALLAVGCAACGSEEESSASPGGSETPVVESSAPETSGQGVEETPIVQEPEMSVGQRNALRSAESYLAFTAFSHQGLVDQLEFEGYTTEEATFAADNCGADWNEQAALCAQNYLDVMSFSRQGLLDQLLFEGFTQEQAEYGVAAAGY